ncbi:MAG: hypothetical protein M1834_009566 [Cirrosporium novae-zelandiae]|nr:MAG: hypothetical protein M1834_009566 [Cirrosporium novae-zelandiae]
MAADSFADSISMASLSSKTFDIIIVGGGTSGLVVASRLTEDPSLNVLVVEAGANRLDDPRVITPGLCATTYFDPDYDWCHMSIPQKGLDGRQVAEPKGRLLGGSTAINLGMMIYPSRAGYNAWEKLGNPGWGWEDMVPYFRKFHTFNPPSAKIRDRLGLEYLDKNIQGTSGPIQASWGQDWYTPYNDAWPETFRQLGYELTGDPLSGVSKGAFSNPGTIDPKTNTRSHAGNAYYNAEVRKRPNLHVITEALVERIMLEKVDAENFAAVGVEIVTKDGQQQNVHAKIEVILAAGAVKTPQLLELSGIGDAELLNSHRIEVLINNRLVGENLQEHGFVPHSWEVADEKTSGDIMRNPEVAGAAMAAYQQSGLGPLGICSLSSSYMPVAEFASESGSSTIDKLIDQYLDSNKFKDFPGQEKQYELIREIFRNANDASGQYTLAPFQLNPQNGPSPKTIFAPTTSGSYISIVAVLNYPFSRGSVHINSADPANQPDLDVGFFTHPLDLELHARHVQWLETLAKTEPMASLFKKDGRRIHGNSVENDLEAAKQLAKERIVPHYHVVGTCAMMPKDLGGVVDNRLKVYGTHNLRIVDASIFPLIPRGNIQSSVYAVSEKAADIIKEDLLSERVIRTKI